MNIRTKVINSVPKEIRFLLAAIGVAMIYYGAAVFVVQESNCKLWPAWYRALCLVVYAITLLFFRVEAKEVDREKQ